MNHSFSIDVDPLRNLILVSNTKGDAQIISNEVNRLGKVLHVFDSKLLPAGQRNHRLGASFLRGSDLIVFDALDNQVLIWNANDGKVVHRLEHPKGKSFMTGHYLRLFTNTRRCTTTSYDCEYLAPSYIGNIAHVIVATSQPNPK